MCSIDDIYYEKENIQDVLEELKEINYFPHRFDSKYNVLPVGDKFRKEKDVKDNSFWNLWDAYKDKNVKLTLSSMALYKMIIDNIERSGNIDCQDISNNSYIVKTFLKQYTKQDLSKAIQTLKDNNLIQVIDNKAILIYNDVINLYHYYFTIPIIIPRTLFYAEQYREKLTDSLNILCRKVFLICFYEAYKDYSLDYKDKALYYICTHKIKHNSKKYVKQLFTVAKIYKVLDYVFIGIEYCYKTYYYQTLDAYEELTDEVLY